MKYLCRNSQIAWIINKTCQPACSSLDLWPRDGLLRNKCLEAGIFRKKGGDRCARSQDQPGPFLDAPAFVGYDWRGNGERRLCNERIRQLVCDKVFLLVSNKPFAELSTVGNHWQCIIQEDVA
jgi:hypothetical protein